jgi:dihydroflavonol-4-reductase
MIGDATLITGATGFIGSHIAQGLLAEPSIPLVSIVRPNQNHKKVTELRSKGAIIVEGSFYDRTLLERIFRQFSIRSVVHIAALRGGGEGKPADYHKLNVMGTEALLEASLKYQVRKFVFCSSVGVFGTIPERLPADTATSLCGDSLYHASKILAEEKTREYALQGLRTITIRPTITYGSGDNGFPSTLVELVKKRLILLPRKDTKVHLLHVDALSRLIKEIVKSRRSAQGVFIAADKEPISFRALANMIHRHYYGREYPLNRIVPNFLFDMLTKGFRLVGNEKWITRLQLISRSWCYDISETLSNFAYIPAKTEETFLKSMCCDN